MATDVWGFVFGDGSQASSISGRCSNEITTSGKNAKGRIQSRRDNWNEFVGDLAVLASMTSRGKIICVGIVWICLFWAIVLAAVRFSVEVLVRAMMLMQK